MSSVTLQREQSGSKFPLIIVGLVFVGIAIFGFIYALYPAPTNVAQIDVGTKLAEASFVGAALRGRPIRSGNGVATEGHPYEMVLAGQQLPVCEIRGVPSSLPEGRTTINPTYICNGQIINPERLKPDWTATAGRIELTNPSTLTIDTTGLAGKRLRLNASFRGCGPNLCQKRWTISVDEPKPELRRIVVRVMDNDGKPVAGAVVTLNQSTRQPTDANGVAQFTDLKPGNYFISVVAGGFKEFSTTRELTSDSALIRVPLVRTETASPSPPTPSPSVEYTPPPSPIPSPTAAPTSETVFARGKNGTLSISWPTTVSSGWSNVCRIRYTPPPEWVAHNVEALFYLTSMTGFTSDLITVPFKPLNQNSQEWEIPLEPEGPDGSLLRAVIVMQVITGPQSSRDIPLQPMQSTIDEKPLTKNQTLGGSTLSGVLGFGFLGIGGIRRKKQEDYPPVTDEPKPLQDVKDWVIDRVGKIGGMFQSTKITGGATDLPEEPEPSAPPQPLPPPAPVPSGETIQVETTAPAESPRYIDVTIYEDHLFPSDDLEEAIKVPDEVPLVASKLYTLEVAIRLKRTGIQSDLPPDREVENPREGEETLTIHVVATPLQGFKIADQLATIKWPFNADSESALFQLEFYPLPRSPGIIEIRILDQSLNLLDIVILKVAIVDYEETALDSSVELRRLTWADKDHEGVSLAGTSKPRLASIHVRPVPFGFEFDFLLYSAQKKAIKIPVSRNISSDDLNFLLSRVRDFWSRLVVTNYANKLAVSATTYDSYLRELRDLGIQAWSLLFDTRTADQEGASERIGQILSSIETPDDENNRIQISYAADYGDFIFPWSILHPPVPKDSPVDPLQFWGARYQIEQVTKGPKKDRIDDRPINVLFALDSTFGDAPSQKKMFEDYQAAAGGELVVSAPISDRKALEDYLIRDPSAHLLYFYCHGYAATRPGLLMADGVKSLKALIEDIRKKSTEGESPTATALEKLMELTSKMAGESWIYLGDSEVKEAELRLLRFFTRRRPIVFLNMCQSADLVPSMSSGLVHLFLDHNASAVVGTESPMTGVFADAFARLVLDHLFAGDNIGTSLWKARRHFLTKGRNPLGLAYTLYGRADANLGNKSRPFVIPAVARQES